FFRFCVQNSFVTVDPTSNLSGRRQDRKLPVFLSYSEVVALIESIPTGDLAGLRDRAIIECLYSTGIRVSELVSLSMGGFPKAGDSFRVIGKRRKERIVFIGEPAKNAVMAYLEVRRREGFEASDDAPLFMNSRGGRLTQRSVQRILSNRSNEAGLRVIPTPHSLRHSFATHLVGGGADLRTVQELLGHASLSTVQIYTHLAPKELIEKYLKSHPLAKGK
ncbi:MAG: tyrosine-type recombinase/integrase, partial [bacterium]